MSPLLNEVCTRLKFINEWVSFVFPGIGNKSQRINAYHFFPPLKVTPKKTSHRARPLRTTGIAGAKTKKFHSSTQRSIKINWTFLQNFLLLASQGILKLRLLFFIQHLRSFFMLRHKRCIIILIFNKEWYNNV